MNQVSDLESNDHAIVSQTSAQCSCTNLCPDQGTIYCASLEFGIGGSGDPRWKWEMREGERERGREKSVAFVCKII